MGVAFSTIIDMNKVDYVISCESIRDKLNTLMNYQKKISCLCLYFLNLTSFTSQLL